VFDHCEVADNLGTPTAGKGIGRLHVNAYEALILGHCAQFSEGAFAHGGEKAPALGERRGSLRASNAGL
jgi:hypothetical protein